MKKTVVSAYIMTHFPIIAAVLLSLTFAFASMHYATNYASTSTTQRLCVWFASKHNV